MNMTESKDQIRKDMCLKLKQSEFLEDFPSSSLQSTLLCTSKVIQLDFNLNGGQVSFQGNSLCNSKNVLHNNKEARNNASKDMPLEAHHGNPANKIIDEYFKFKKLRFQSDSIEDGMKKCGDHPKSSAVHEKVKLDNSFEFRQQKIQHFAGEFSHCQQQVKNENFSCDICGKHYTSKRSVTRHKKIHSPTKYECEICYKIFRTKGNIQTHLRTMHNVKRKFAK